VHCWEPWEREPPANDFERCFGKNACFDDDCIHERNL